MTDAFIELELLRHGFIYLGERSIVKQGSRYTIYLPLEQKDLWEK